MMEGGPNRNVRFGPPFNMAVYFTVIRSYSLVPRPIFSAWMRQSSHPASGVVYHKMIVVVAETILMHPIIEKTSRQRILSVAGVHTCLVKSHRIEACEHSDIRQDRHVILSVAVTVRRNVDHQIDVEVRATVYDRLGVFGDLHVKLFTAEEFSLKMASKLQEPRQRPHPTHFSWVIDA